jgi:hypothetical protein
LKDPLNRTRISSDGEIRPPPRDSSLLGVQTLGLGVLVLGMLSTDRNVGLMGIAVATAVSWKLSR